MGAPPPLALDHLVIAVSDFERSNAFYRDVLGADIEQRGPSSAFYRFAGWGLSVHGPGLEALKAGVPVEPGNSDLCFVWPGTVDEALAHLALHRVAVVSGPLDRVTGARKALCTSVYFRDPDGSLLELMIYGSTVSSTSSTAGP